MPRTAKPDAPTQIQRLILDAAAVHPEHRLDRPDGVKPPSYRSALQALRRRGLIADEAGAKRSGRRTGPVLTQAGLAFVAPIAPAPDAIVSQPAVRAVIQAPRPGTKLAHLIAMLSCPDGASIDALIAAFGWLPHTTRAALTGLRKRGYALATIRSPGAPTRYRIATDSVANQTATIATEEAAR